VTARTRRVRRCTWRDCVAPAAATVAFELPNLLAGSRRDYCAAHTTQACIARGCCATRWMRMTATRSVGTIWA